MEAWAKKVVHSLSNDVASSAVPILFTIFLAGERGVILDADSLSLGLERVEESLKSRFYGARERSSIAYLTQEIAEAYWDAFVNNGVAQKHSALFTKPVTDISATEISTVIQYLSKEAAPYVGEMRKWWESQEPDWGYPNPEYWPLAEKILTESQKRYTSGGLGRTFV